MMYLNLPVNLKLKVAKLQIKYISYAGTAFSDTLCGDCGLNTYSDGSFTFCRPHTQYDY